ncbi:hypothetical protein Tco_0095968, partial [Tanacetum coccineum]
MTTIQPSPPSSLRHLIQPPPHHSNHPTTAAVTAAVRLVYISRKGPFGFVTAARLRLVLVVCTIVGCVGFGTADKKGAFGCGNRRKGVFGLSWVYGSQRSGCVWLSGSAGGVGCVLVVGSTAKGAFCFGLDPHRVRLAATAARDVWLAVLKAERVFVSAFITRKGVFVLAVKQPYRAFGSGLT